MTDRLEGIGAHVAERWDDELVDLLHDYIRIPCKSPMFDPDWAANGHIDAAVDLLAGWARSRPLPGMTVDVLRLEGRTPLIVCEIPASPGAPSDAGTVMLYGHLDKQPEMHGWDDGKGPWLPVLDGDRLYGRGGADDGYSTLSAITAVEALLAAGGEHGRLVVLIEASEESGSPDLPHQVDALAGRIGDVDLVVCLDSSCATYDALWVTTSLRGLVGGTLRADVLDKGEHSGSASGVVPSSFRVLRAALSRVEDEATGRVLVPEMHVEVPAERAEQVAAAAAVIGDDLLRGHPWAGGTRPMVDDPTEALLQRTWRPTLSVTGLAGAPDLAAAGNVLRPWTAAKLSFRIPPLCDADAAAAAVKRALESDPLHGAPVTFEVEEAATGWAAPPTAPWLAAALDAASTAEFGAPARAIGEGGSIPFMGMLGERFPAAQFAVIGVLGPGSSAHGPNEFLHLPTAARITGCVARLLDAHARR